MKKQYKRIKIDNKLPNCNIYYNIKYPQMFHTASEVLAEKCRELCLKLKLTETKCRHLQTQLDEEIEKNENNLRIAGILALGINND